MPRSLQGAACELCDLALPAADLFGGREGKGEGRGGEGGGQLQLLNAVIRTGSPEVLHGQLESRTVSRNIANDHCVQRFHWTSLTE